MDDNRNENLLNDALHKVNYKTNLIHKDPNELDAIMLVLYSGIPRSVFTCPGYSYKSALAFFDQREDDFKHLYPMEKLRRIFSETDPTKVLDDNYDPANLIHILPPLRYDGKGSYMIAKDFGSSSAYSAVIDYASGS